MTIGIAAVGAGAGTAVVRALQAVESIGRGAIGGFVSLAAISNGTIERAEVQQDGTQALFPGGVPAWLPASYCAVLMSSGPNRPTPLSQFTPGDATAGLLTGHRFPTSLDHAGNPLNLVALARLRQGEDPQTAVDRVAAENPNADAGLVAVTPDGRVGLCDCAYLAQFADRGQAVLTTGHGAVAVAHNAIVPYRGLALIAAEVAMDALGPAPGARLRIELQAGLPLRHGSRNAVQVGPDGAVLGLVVADPLLLVGTRSFGLGYRAPVIGSSRDCWLHYEPYLVSSDGILQSVDGKPREAIVAGFSR